MALPSTYTGDTWERIRVALVYAVDSLNGRVDVNGQIFPRMNNGQALAIAQAWKGLLAANKQTLPAALWPELWYRALGYHQPGDKFNMSHEHANAPALADVVAGVWALAEYAAQRLDEKGAQPKLLVLDLSFGGYERAAKDAYERLKKDRAPPKTPLPGNPPGAPPLKPPPDVKLPLPTVPSMQGTGLLLLLIVVALAVRKGK